MMPVDPLRCQQIATLLRRPRSVIVDYTEADPHWSGSAASQLHDEQDAAMERGGQELASALEQAVAVSQLSVFAMAQHLDALAVLFETERPPSYSVSVLARAVIELAASVWWDTDPGVDVRVRVARGFKRHEHGDGRHRTVQASHNMRLYRPRPEFFDPMPFTFDVARTQHDGQAPPATAIDRIAVTAHNEIVTVELDHALRAISVVLVLDELGQDISRRVAEREFGKEARADSKTEIETLVDACQSRHGYRHPSALSASSAVAPLTVLSVRPSFLLLADEPGERRMSTALRRSSRKTSSRYPTRNATRSKAAPPTPVVVGALAPVDRMTTMKIR